MEARGYITQFLQPTVALRDEAQQAAETALTLQPNLGEAILAKGFYHYACLKDYDTAVRYFEQARPLLPNSSRIPESLAYVNAEARPVGSERVVFQRSRATRPAECLPAYTARAFLQGSSVVFPEALRKFEQILNITPDDMDTIAEKAVIAQAEGDSAAGFGSSGSAATGGRRHERVGNTSLPSDLGAPSCTNHVPAQGNTGQA